jgi:hypothetical protein
VKATLILCDAAQADPAGKVHILGVGWTVVIVPPGVPMPAHAVVAIVHVPWHETLEPHQIRLRLEDADGRAVMVGSAPDQLIPLVHDQQIEVRRPPGAPEGITLDVPIVVSVAPGLPLTDGRYSWRLEIDGASDEDWLASFHVRIG